MFKWILDASLRNRLLVVLCGIVVMVYGAATLRTSPVDVFPDLNKPTVTIMTEAGGMAAEEVEQQITRSLESALGGLPNVESVRTISSAGLSFVYLTFDWSVDVYRARQFVSERLGSMETTFPTGIVPRMGPVSSIMGEIMMIAIPIDKAATTPMQVREYADWVLRPRLLAIPGVAQVIPIGGEVRQYLVHPDTTKMTQLDVTHDQITSALRGFSANTSGGFLELNGREYLIRHLGQTTKVENLANTAVHVRNGQPIFLKQVASVALAAAPKRGDAGFEGQPAVILGIQKQPTADTLALTRSIESALVDLKKSRPAGVGEPRVTFRQASFIDASVSTLQGKLVGASIFVAAILLLFLGTVRPTLIALTAIPISICVTALVFKWFGMTINTMTLGGLAIAIGGLVDDAVVDVENTIRRLRLAFANGRSGVDVLRVVRDASIEVRSGIVYATFIIVLVFLPLFALPGIEGRLFIPLGIAFIVSTLASLLVSVTMTPVLAYHLIPNMKRLSHGETWFVRLLKRGYVPTLHAVLRHPKAAMATAAIAVSAAAAAVPFFATSFLPPFNEGTLLIGIRLNPGVTLSESSTLAAQAEKLVRGVPEVTHVGRRSGRAELDEHAEGVHVSELDVGLVPTAQLTRSMAEVQADIRKRLEFLPGAIAMGQPISHRIDHMLSGVRSQIAIKIFGEDLDALRSQAAVVEATLRSVPGIADLEIEKQVLAPQIKVRVDYDRAAQLGIAASRVLQELEGLVQGEKITTIVDNGRPFDLVVRLAQTERSAQALANVMIKTPTGSVPLSRIAEIEESDGPNQISRDDGKRRIVLSANTQGRPLSEVIADIRARLAEVKLPEGVFVTLGGQFQAQEEASKTVGLLSLVSLVMMFAVLYSRYQSTTLALLILSNIPLALVGAVIGLWWSGQPLSVAALIGFITLGGIAVRNGILKVSHYLNLMRSEGESFSIAMIVRGSNERLVPVLMTALVTACALAPLLFEAERPGTEILHPVAVVIFFGLISATLLDTLLTPTLFWMFGRKPAERVLAHTESDATF